MEIRYGFFHEGVGGLEFHISIVKNNFFENHLENVFCTLYYVCHELFFFNPSYSYLDH